MVVDHEDPGEPTTWRAPVQVLADLAEPARVLPAGEPLEHVQRLFDSDPGLRQVVLEAADGFHLLDRVHLDHVRRTRRGDAGFAALSPVERPASVVLPDRTPVDEAAATVLGCDATSSLEAVVCVDGAGRAGVVPVRRLFVSLSRTFARQSVLDPLTGLPNRLHLMHLLDRRVPATPTALLYVDLDRFKDVNDGYGHAAGDAVLVEFASRMRHCCRAEDVVLRLGGDEFAVLVPTHVGDDALRALAGRVVAAAAAPFTVPMPGPDGAQGGRAVVHVGASVGVARRPAGEPEDALGLMLAQADAAMYLAKDQGRGTVRTSEDVERVAASGTDDRTSRHTLERRLREALDGSGGSRLHLVLQPIVDLTTGEVVELEALARWDDSLLGAVPPDRFVPVAEAGGLILDLGRWALNAACAEAVTWVGRDGGVGAPPAVSVNVSPLQLVDPAFEGDVLLALDRAGLPTDRLVLEITEAAGVDDLPRTAAVLHRLRSRGVRVALDDFGAGRSSLTLLRHLPLDTVKLDRSLVSSAFSTVTDALVLRCLVEVCHGLGLRVCTEGIEEEAQAAWVTGLGADTGQGWCFGRPVPGGQGAVAPSRTYRPHPPGPTERGSDEFVVAVADGRVVYASTRVFDVLGLLPSDVVGRRLDTLQEPGDRPFGGHGTVRLRHADGSLRWVCLGPAGGPEDHLGVDGAVLLRCRDVTPVVEAQHRLLEVEETFRLVFDGAPSGMALSGLDGTIHRVNRAFAVLLGRSAESLVGVRVEDITWPEDRAADEHHLGRHREGEGLESPVRKRYVGGDGAPVPVHVQVSLVHDADGRPAAVVAHVRAAP